MTISLSTPYLGPLTALSGHLSIGFSSLILPNWSMGVCCRSRSRQLVRMKATHELLLTRADRLTAASK